MEVWFIIRNFKIWIDWARRQNNIFSVDSGADASEIGIKFQKLSFGKYGTLFVILKSESIEPDVKITFFWVDSEADASEIWIKFQKLSFWKYGSLFVILKSGSIEYHAKITYFLIDSGALDHYESLELNIESNYQWFKANLVRMIDQNGN